MSYFIMNFINKLKNILLVRNYVKKEKYISFYAKLCLLSWTGICKLMSGDNKSIIWSWTDKEEEK